jgi:hypothetical protein
MAITVVYAPVRVSAMNEDFSWERERDGLAGNYVAIHSLAPGLHSMAILLPKVKGEA